MFDPYRLSAKVGYSYNLELLLTICIENVFHQSWLCSRVTNPLLGQTNATPLPFAVDNEKK